MDLFAVFVDKRDSRWSGAYLLLGVFSSREEVEKAYPGNKYEGEEIDVIEVTLNDPNVEDRVVGSYDG